MSRPGLWTVTFTSDELGTMSANPNMASWENGQVTVVGILYIYIYIYINCHLPLELIGEMSSHQRPYIISTVLNLIKNLSISIGPKNLNPATALNPLSCKPILG
jgi:hypothetical protein